MRRAQWALVVVVVLAAMLGGCVRYYWTKPGSTQAQFENDSRECVQEARKTVPGPVTGLAVGVIEERYRLCLMGRGYIRDKQTDPPVPGSYRGIESDDELAAAAAAAKP